MADIETAIACLAFLVLAGCAFADRHHLRRHGGLVLIAIAVFVVRWIVATPTFAHAHHHGIELLDSPWADPWHSFRNYGPVGSLIHGGIMHAVTPDLTVVAATNQLFASATVVPMALLARRWFPDSSAAPWLVVVTVAIHPVLIRMGSSEDAHAIGAFFCWLSILLVDEHATSGSRRALVAGTAAMILGVYTRQILFAFAPVPFVLAMFDRRSRRLVLPAPIVLAGAAVVASLAVRMAASLADDVQASYVTSIGPRLSDPVIVGAALAEHPLLAPLRFGVHLLPAIILGATVLAREWQGRAFLTCAAWLFLSSVWLYEGESVSFMFRAPAMGAWLLVAGVGVAWAVDQLAARGLPPRAVASALGVTCVLATILAPGWRVLGQVQPITLEYRYLQRTAADLPPGSRVLMLGASGTGPNYSVPHHVLETAGSDLEVVPDREGTPGGEGPLLFVAGVRCHAYSMIEARGLDTIPRGGVFQTANNPAMQDLLLSAVRNEPPPDGTLPNGPRPECAQLLTGARPVTTRDELDGSLDDVPFVVYSTDRIPIQIYELDRTVVADWFRSSRHRR